jgi:hypothetical protein
VAQILQDCVSKEASCGFEDYTIVMANRNSHKVLESELYVASALFSCLLLELRSGIIIIVIINEYQRIVAT